MLTIKWSNKCVSLYLFEILNTKAPHMFAQIICIFRIGTSKQSLLKIEVKWVCPALATYPQPIHGVYEKEAAIFCITNIFVNL